MNSLYCPTRAQLELRRLIRLKTRILAYGGSRSGKTFEFCRALTTLAFRYGGRYGVFRRYFNSVKNSVLGDTFPKMLELCFPDLKYTVNSTDAKITFAHNDSEICFIGLDDPKQAEKILGREFASVYFNECSEIPYRSIELAMTRLAQLRRDDAGKTLVNRAFFDCNPPGKSHWTYRLFIEGVSPVSNTKIVDPENYGAIQINPTDNIENLPKGYVESTLGASSERNKKRFLYGEFSNDAENALWKLATIDRYRTPDIPAELERIVVAVDPAVTSTVQSDNTGIVVAGRRLERDGQNRYYVLDDRSINATPERWAREVVEAYHFWQADAVVVETNQGGDLVASVLRQVDPNLPIKKVRATRGKILRAEPISILYEHGRVSHVGIFAALEEEMISYAGASTPNQSVDRLDALVWALTDLTEYGGDCYGGFVTF